MSMIPETKYGDFVMLDTNEGTIFVPLECFEYSDYNNHYKIHDLKIETAWFARLSMPGYLDCTEWMGPFFSEKEAIKEIMDFYGEENQDVVQ
jgi:hypothetical protein